MKKKKTVLLVGCKGLVGGAFTEIYGEEYDIIPIGSENSTSIFDIHESIDAMVYLAQSADYKSAAMTPDLFRTNVSYFYQCLDHFKNKVQRLIFFSTGSVYRLDTGQTINVDSPLNTEAPSPYVASKIAAEMIVRSYKKNFPYIGILRPFFIYGKQQKENMLLKMMYNNVLNEIEIQLSGPRGLVFNPVHARDAASAIDHLLTNGETGLTTYNLSGPEECCLNDLVILLSDICGKKAKVRVSGNVDSRIVAESNIPGWRPEVDIRQGLAMTFNAQV